MQALILRKADNNSKETFADKRKPISVEKEQTVISHYHEGEVSSSSHIEIEFDFVEANEQQLAFELPKLSDEPKEALSEKKKQQLEIIDRFIKAEPRIIPKEINKDQIPDLSVESTVETEFLTETLAEIYVRQKKYDKAIVMFQKLSLKLPQKSVYFASRISDINTIVNQDKN